MGRSWRRAGAAAAYLVAFMTLALAAVWPAVRIAPLQMVRVVGQTVEVGAVPPGLSLSGPGKLELFGQAMPTEQHFHGPIRPRLKLTDIAADEQVAELLRSGDPRKVKLAVGRPLASAWLRYGLWETAIAVGLVLLVLTAATGVRRLPLRRSIVVIAGGVAVTVAVNLAGFYLLAADTPRLLRRVQSLEDLVGRAPLNPVPPAAGPALQDVRAVVMGDSTAAGAGNRLLPHASALDRACGRSVDSYAQALARANDWNVLNVACSGATVRDGILGEQILGNRVAPPQLAEARRASHATAVIISTGSNDIHWADLTRLCAASPTCDDKATNAYFRDQLTRFTLDYHELLRHLDTLPQHPVVLVNEYYDPFGPKTECLRSEGLTNAKAQILRSRLSQLNSVLRQGAMASGFVSVRPDFTGHELCSPQPYVQGSAQRAPLHPTAAGELAIALADQRALARPPRPTPKP